MPSLWGWCYGAASAVESHRRDMAIRKAKKARGELLYQRIAVVFLRWNAKHKKEQRQVWLRRNRDAQIRAAQAKVHPRYRKKLPY
jgi:hypothetical protein